MTIAAGFVCLDGIVLCADTQETIAGYTKNNTDKIKMASEDDFTVAITGAGDAELIETATQKIIRAMVDHRYNYEKHDYRAVVEESFLEFFDRHIAPYSSFPRDDRPYVELLIALQLGDLPNRSHMLLKATGTAIRKVGGAECIGSGLVLAKSLVEKLYCGWGWNELDEMVTIAAYIMYEAKQWVDGCGGNTDMFVMSNLANLRDWMGSRDIEAVEGCFKAFNEHVLPYLESWASPNVDNEILEKSWKRAFDHMMSSRAQALAGENRFLKMLQKIKAARDARHAAWMARKEAEEKAKDGPKQ